MSPGTGPVARDFLLELRCEEIPARMQQGAREELERLFRAAMDAAGVGVDDITVWSTPRRLALIARDLPAHTDAVREETKGPRTSAPDKALEGFLRKTGLTKEQLEDRHGVWFAVIDRPGRAVRDLLADAIPAIVRDFSWLRSMRWGADSVSTESLRWVRPLSGITAILGEDLVECAVGEIAAGYATLGHRFHHDGPITIGGAHDYAEKLRACHVIVDHEERAAMIRDGAARAAREAGLTLVEDEGLVVENAGLTEWPVPLLGRFDPDYLSVPPEVIRLTARTNQKYFICRTGSGDLANAFVCTANIEAADGGESVVAGNRKVLAARLSDARFFWEQDRRKTLAQHAEGLKRIIFHEKLGTVADKVERVAKLARWLVEEGIVKGADPDRVEQAARLAKSDLTTEMVGEFPELQGVTGGYYARAEGLSDEVADAIRDHYRPVGQGDEVPTAPVTVAVSLADKLDSLAGFFAIDEKPTGSKDPFALRRAALAVSAILIENRIRLPLLVSLANGLVGHVETALITASRSSTVLEGRKAVGASWGKIAEQGKYEAAVRKALADLEGELGDAAAAKANLASLRAISAQTVGDLSLEILAFLADRLKVQQREAGVRHDLIDAVFALGGEDDLVRLLARVKALQAFIETGDGESLLVAYKRAANILRKEDYTGPDERIARTGEEDPLALVDDPDIGPIIAQRARDAGRPSYPREPAEQALVDALDRAEPAAARAVAEEDFTAAMAALASLRAPIDEFFDRVTVNDPDRAKRAARLALLDRFRVAVHNVADFSRIEG